MGEASTTNSIDSGLVEILTENLEKPLLDDRLYRVIRLPNKLEALLIHDPETDKAGAAMDVGVGAIHDPKELQGMSHAIEHLVHMGTAKYPKNAFHQYITSHSGSRNAYTQVTSTNYHFDVGVSPHTGKATPTPSDEVVSATPLSSSDDQEASVLYEALDRFAQFFLSPLFLQETLDEELKVVDSEHKKNLQGDAWRLGQLGKSLLNPEHPYQHQLGTGNLQTLKEEPLKRGIVVREEVIKFYHKHYSANRMKLVVLGQEPLDTLQEWVQDLFSGIQNNNSLPETWDMPLMTENEVLFQCFAKPVIETRYLEIVFPYPNEEELYESCPRRYLTHLLGHEGPGSILAYLKAKGWSDGLFAGVTTLHQGPALFKVRASLTEEGLKRYLEVVKVIFRYISLLHATPPQEWIFEEKKRLAEVSFRFRQKGRPSSTTSALATKMQELLPREWLLNSMARKFDPEGIKRGMSNLRPDNFTLMIVSQTYPGNWDQREKWYGTEYRKERIPADFLEELRSIANSASESWVPDLHLPHKNEFIPVKLEVERMDVKEPAEWPKLIRNDEGIRLWWKKDDQFWVPKGTVAVKIRNPLMALGPEWAMKGMLYCMLINDALSEYAYDAELAGLSYNISTISDGLSIIVSGYNDKLSVLLEKVLICIRDLEVKQERFDIKKEHLMRHLRNLDLRGPSQQIRSLTQWLNAERSWLNEEYLAEASFIKSDDIKTFIPQLLGQLHIEAFVHGNYSKADALQLVNTVDSIFKARPLPQSEWPLYRCVILPHGSNYIHPRPLKDPANINHCIDYFLFLGETTDRALRARLLLFAQLTKEAAFDQLRTKEQLGYIVQSGAAMTSTTMGFSILIQSLKAPAELERRIEAFLAGFARTMEEMGTDEFERHKRSLCDSRLEKDKNMFEETNRFWRQIRNQHLDFECATHDVAHITPLSKTDVQAFYAHYISPLSASRAKLSVHLLAQSPQSEASPKEPSTEPAPPPSSVATPAPPDVSTSTSTSPSTTKTPEDVTNDNNNANPPADPTAAISTPAAVPELEPQINGAYEEKVEVNSEKQRPDVVIDDVRAFKAGLGLSRAARAVVELSFFEEGGEGEGKSRD